MRDFLRELKLKPSVDRLIISFYIICELHIIRMSSIFDL